MHAMSAPISFDSIIIRAVSPASIQISQLRHAKYLWLGLTKGNPAPPPSKKKEKKITPIRENDRFALITRPTFGRYLSHNNLQWGHCLIKFLTRTSNWTVICTGSGLLRSNLDLPFKWLVHKSHFYIATAVVAATYDRSTTAGLVLINGRWK
jgi:hypothetical protein